MSRIVYLRLLGFLVSALTIAALLASASAQGPDLPATAAGRYLVVYKNGQIPGDAEGSASAAGGRLTRRHERMGLAVVEEMNEAARARLAADPAVEAVVPDLVLNAHALATRNALPEPPLSAQRGLNLAEAVTRAHRGSTFRAADASRANTPHPQGFPSFQAGPWKGSAPMPPGTAPMPSGTAPMPDALYHSPQGWAVRQVGGFGADGTAAAVAGPWNVSQGKGVRIAILDSGVDAGHPDIAPNLALNLSDVVRAAMPTPCDDGSPADQTGHGTWAASLAAGALGANTGLVAGVAPQAEILNIKVLQRMPAAKTAADPTGCLNGQAAGLLSWTIQGIEDAVLQHAQVISMSFGSLVDITTGPGAGLQTIFNRATQAAFQAGVVLIAAAGNDAYNTANQRAVELPAQSRGVLAIVASTNPACAQNLAAGAACVAGPVTTPYYTNYGAPLNALAAPGGSYPTAGTLDPASSPDTVTGWVTGACSSGLRSTASGLPVDASHSLGCFNLGHTAYVQAMGTSASAPLVAGAAALLLAAHPAWTPGQVVQALRGAALKPTAAMPVPQVSVAGLLPGR